MKHFTKAVIRVVSEVVYSLRVVAVVAFFSSKQ